MRLGERATGRAVASGQIGIREIAHELPREFRIRGGGARGRFWNQVMADIFGLPVQRLKVLEEATSMGAALAGMIGGLIGGAIDRLRSRAGKLKRLWSFILAVNSFERER